MLWPTGPTRFDPAGRPRATSGASRDEKVMSASPSTRGAAITTTAAMSRPIPVPGVPSLRFPDLLLLLECPIAPRPSYPPPARLLADALDEASTSQRPSRPSPRCRRISGGIDRSIFRASSGAGPGARLTDTVEYQVLAYHHRRGLTSPDPWTSAASDAGPSTCSVMNRSGPTA